MSDDGLCCVGFTIKTRAGLVEHGIPFEYAFLLSIEREDGSVQDMAVLSAQSLAQLFRDLNPRHVEIKAAEHEDCELLAGLLNETVRLH